MNPYLTYSFFEGHTESFIIKGVGSEKVGQADIRVVCGGVGLQHGLVLTTGPALTTDCNKQSNQHLASDMIKPTVTW